MTRELGEGASETDRVIEFDMDTDLRRAILPADANETEAAAIAAAVAAHLEGVETAVEESTPLACPWTVAGRLEPATGRCPQGRHDLPGDCPRGEEWTYAGRCR